MASAGARDHLVTVEKRTAVTSPGYPVETWTRLGAFYMSRSDSAAATASNERFTAAQVAAYQATVWQMPYVATMDPEAVDVPATRRLVSQGRTYDIQSAARSKDHGIELVTLTKTAVV